MKEIKLDFVIVDKPRDYLDRLAFSGPGGQKSYLARTCLSFNAKSLYTKALELLVQEKKLAFADALVLLSQLCDYCAVDDIGNRHNHLEKVTELLLLSYRANKEHAVGLRNIEFGENWLSEKGASFFLKTLSEYAYGFALPEEKMLFVLSSFADKRLQGIALAKIIEKSAFHNSIFEVTEHTLEPTIKSEKLISLIENDLAESVDKKNILELGVGSGALLISLIKADATRVGYGVELSPDAFQVAKQNIKMHGLKDRIHLFQGSWFEPIPKDIKFDVIYSNPPYLDPVEIKALSIDKKNEPYMAYDGGLQGLDPYKIILAQAKGYLNPGGQILLEINNRRAGLVAGLMENNGFSCSLHYDVAKKPRVLAGHIIS